MQAIIAGVTDFAREKEIITEEILYGRTSVASNKILVPAKLRNAFPPACVRKKSRVGRQVQALSKRYIPCSRVASSLVRQPLICTSPNTIYGPG